MLQNNNTSMPLCPLHMRAMRPISIFGLNVWSCEECNPALTVNTEPVQAFQFNSGLLSRVEKQSERIKKAIAHSTGEEPTEILPELTPDQYQKFMQMIHDDKEPTGETLRIETMPRRKHRTWWQRLLRRKTSK